MKQFLGVIPFTVMLRDESEMESRVTRDELELYYFVTVPRGVQEAAALKPRLLPKTPRPRQMGRYVGAAHIRAPVVSSHGFSITKCLAPR